MEGKCDAQDREHIYYSMAFSGHLAQKKFAIISIQHI